MFAMAGTMSKTISVIMPNYNDSESISIAVKSICEQSYPPKELIIIDDGSTDNSLEVIAKLVAQFPCIKLICNQTNRGISYSVNKGLSTATGDYIYNAAADSFVFPEFFEKSINLLSRYPQAGLCCADVRIMHPLTESFYDLQTNWSSEPAYFSPDQLAEVTANIARTEKGLLMPHISKKGLLMPTSSTCITRKDLIPKDTVYISELECYSDWFLHQVIVFRHGCCFIPEALAAVSWTGNSYGNRCLSNKKLYRQIFAEMLRLLAAPEYEDVARLIVKGHSLNLIDVPIRSPIFTAAILSNLKRPNGQVKNLFLYLIVDYFYDFPKYIWQEITQSSLSIKLRESCTKLFHRLKNYLDRFYARSFHEYDKARSMIQKKLN
jgi:glycosyltransferase involved in cell wall biosynthesis